MKKLNKSYCTLFLKLEKFDHPWNNESGHILQDKLYRKFIRDIRNNKFKNIKEIKEFANYMNTYVVKRDKGRWYS